MIQMTCPGCGKTLRIRDKYLGTTGKCKRCLTQVTVEIPPGIHMENPGVISFETIPTDNQATSVFCPGCRNTIPLDLPCENTKITCERCGTVWTLEKLARKIEEGDEFTSPVIRETWQQTRTRMPETL